MSLEGRIRASEKEGLPAYVELTKPGITLFVAVTAAAGYTMAALPGFSAMALLHVAFGTALTTAGALAQNQVLERKLDALMLRTHRRPVPSGRVSPDRALAFGWVLAAAGAGHLWFWSGWIPALLAVASLLLYNWAYTPLKVRSPAATLVGAVPGALPALIGWTAHAGTAHLRGGFVLFGILFLWQLVHVLALGWNLREDYKRAGFRLIPAGSPRLLSGLLVGCTAALLPVSVLPSAIGLTGIPYLLTAVFLGAALLGAALAFLANPSRRRCRRVFVGSLVYHPMLLAAMVAGAVL